MLPSRFPEVQSHHDLKHLLAARVDMQFEDVRTMLELATGGVEGLSSVRIQVDIGSGRPADEIIAVAEARVVDFVVIGIHGRSGLRRRMLGSVAHHVVLAACPVLTVGSGALSEEEALGAA
jgi:nucleotide-binding universal stress UspA family protein